MNRVKKRSQYKFDVCLRGIQLIDHLLSQRTRRENYSNKDRGKAHTQTVNIRQPSARLLHAKWAGVTPPTCIANILSKIPGEDDSAVTTLRRSHVRFSIVNINLAMNSGRCISRIWP